MRLLQRYILYELLRVFAFLLSALTVLLMFVGVFREASESGLGPMQILQIMPFVVPSLLPFTIPATLLLTICVVYGRIAGDQEITAAKAAGINVMSLLWPALLLGGVLSIGSLVLTDQVIPWAVANIQRTVAAAMEDIFLDLLRTQHHMTDDRRGFSVTVEDVRDDVLIGPVFQYTPRGSSPVTIQAEQATLDFDLKQQHVMLHLVRGYLDAPGGQIAWFEHEDQPFPLPQEVSRPKARHMTIRDIRRHLRESDVKFAEAREHRDAETALALLSGDFDRMLQPDFRVHEYNIATERDEQARLHTEVHSRFSMSVSCLFFVLVGGPFSILQGRKQFLTSFFLCFLPILLIYYPATLLMMNLSKSGTVEPEYVMWLGNAMLLLAGAHLLRKVLRH